MPRPALPCSPRLRDTPAPGRLPGASLSISPSSWRREGMLAFRSGPHVYIAAFTTGQRLHAGFQRSGCLGRAACRTHKVAGVWLFAAAAGPAKAAPKGAAAAAAPKQCCEVSMSESDVGSQAEWSKSKSLLALAGTGIFQPKRSISSRFHQKFRKRTGSQTLIGLKYSRRFGTLQ